MVTRIQELEPRYDSRKSFYGKAKIVIKTKYIELYSYDLLVARISLYKDNQYMACSERLLKLFNRPEHSNTTKRHIREFYKQYKNEYMTNKEINKELWS